MRRVLSTTLLSGAVALLPVAVLPVVPPAAAAPAERTELYLVALAGSPTAPLAEQRERQDAVLGRLGDADPVYRWSTALNGFAARLTATQAAGLAGDPDVAAVERSQVRRLTARDTRRLGTTSSASAPLARGAGATPKTTPRAAAPDSGAGVVVGFVDTGLSPGAPGLQAVPGLPARPSSFTGGCESAAGWQATDCTAKVVAARAFVDGFGTDALRANSSISPRDDEGHGTETASLAIGNAETSVQIGRRIVDTHSGVAPTALAAVYKACWMAPDPDDDGCATADLVTAVDRATADGVDVLNLPVAGGRLFDVLDRALLGATEHGVVVAGAAGNRGRAAAAAHPGPWVTSVAAIRDRLPGGAVTLDGGVALRGVMVARRVVTAPLVSAASVAAAGADPAAARRCEPRTLDAARTRGRIVVCERGRIGRVDKSQTVALADGVGMVLVDAAGGSVTADQHAVPTVHLPAAAGERLLGWLRTHEGEQVSLRPGGRYGSAPAIADYSSPGDPRGDLVKPDLAATGNAALAATASGWPGRAAWVYVDGTSAATAAVSGAAAAVLARHPDWTPAEVHSALVTTAEPLPASPTLAQGGGRVRPDRAVSPGLVLRLRDRAYRDYLDRSVRGAALNLPSIHTGGATTVSRTVTNVGSRAMYYSSSTRGFTDHAVTVRPAAIRIAPGASERFTVTVGGPRSRAVDGGAVIWRGADGTEVRLPVVVND